jgi:hypothetical protein
MFVCLEFRSVSLVVLAVAKAVCALHSFASSNRPAERSSSIMLTFVILVYMMFDRKLLLFLK